MENTITEPLVRCNMCEWSGTEEGLVICKDKAKEGDTERHFFRGCPNCKTDDYLMDK